MLTLGKVSIHPGFWGVLVFAIWIGAGEVLPLVGVAALCHEMGHLAALRLAGAAVEGICFTSFGAEIRADTRYLPYWKDLLCTMAGPAVNIVLALLFARVSEDYLLAGANLMQGIFNLLPVPGTDGSRMMNLLLSWTLDPDRADGICRAVELCCGGAMCAVCLYLVVRGQGGVFLLLASVGIFRSALRQYNGK